MSTAILLPWRWLGAGLLFLALDRWLKSLALNGVNTDWSWLGFGLVKNYGLVFSWEVPGAIMVVLLGAAIVAIAVVIYRWLDRDKIVSGAALLMLMGAASNLFDRWRYGFVIDWANLGPWWPVFNLADVMLMVGLVALVTRRSLTN